MLVKFTASILLAGSVCLAQNDTEPEEPGLRKMKFIHQMVYSQLNTAMTIRQIELRLQNYGCHCFAENSRAAGGPGQALDELDSLCLDLKRCHKCIEMDFGNAVTDQWDADVGKYRFDVDSVTSEISCDRNTDPEKKALCQCDAFFAKQVGAMWVDADYNEANWHNKKEGKATWVYEDTCKHKDEMKAADSCCGAYPERKSFSSIDRDCCGNTIYSVVSQDCCAGDVTKPIGMC